LRSFTRIGAAGQPIVFSHGWPLSGDDWDPQMLFFLSKGYRVIAHDRRGHGRSTQVGHGHDLDHYADDLAAVIEHLDLRNAIHIGHSTGGGEVIRYLARHGESRAAKMAIISAVPPLMVKTAANPSGLPNQSLTFKLSFLPIAVSSISISRQVRSTVSTARAWTHTCDLLELVAGGAKAHYDGIVAFSQTDFTEDLKKITLPALVMHSEDDDRPLCRCRSALGQTPYERHIEDIQKLSARNDHDTGRSHQRGCSLLPRVVAV
jgi:non-heme chloroperoxidase